MLVIVQIPFVGHGFNMPNPGELIEVPGDVAQHLMTMGAVAPYETKVDPLPPEVKKKAAPSALSRRGRQPTKTTPKRSKRSATK